VHHAPEQPAKEAGELEPAELHHRGVAADGGEVAHVAITKWRWRRPARDARGDEPADIASRAARCRECRVDPSPQRCRRLRRCRNGSAPTDRRGPSGRKRGGRWDAAQSKSGDPHAAAAPEEILPSTSPHVRNSPDCGLKIGGDVTAALYQLRTHAVQQGASHSITSSASVSSIGGTVRPSVFAVLRLITKSNFIGCCTGRSAGFVPRKILSM
jgi:hypothetical protein